MAEKNYSKREIDSKIENFKNVSDANRQEIIETVTRNDKDTRESLTRIEIKMNSIETQTIKTNGRVSELENWKAYVVGFCVAITTLLLPLIFLVAKAYLHV